VKHGRHKLANYYYQPPTLPTAELPERGLQNEPTVSASRPRRETYQFFSLGIALALAKSLQLLSCSLKLALLGQNLGFLEMSLCECRVELQYTFKVV
jgi:hypothetical protein